MKRSMVLIAFLLCSSIALKAAASDKDSLLRVFQQTEARLLSDVTGLSDQQLNFKTDTSSWSIGQCVEHIVKTESMLLGTAQDLMKQPANPEKRGALKGKDSDVIVMIQDRTHKFKAPAPLQPDEKSYHLSEVVNDFKKQRAGTLDFIRNTPMEDLRSHLTVTPAKEYADAYRMLLYIVGHCLRHTEQIEEVKAANSFPKN
ncbi:DinB family protein [Olivibacter sp. XZL3]|uniref:DinB family protein n=1 Tax=Olivibacter sp. XZL3 TaxID=1735116 RepID=UPI001065BF9B|nr:DinB family protein [Olivibacter sp. XZL3]